LLFAPDVAASGSQEIASEAEEANKPEFCQMAALPLIVFDVSERLLDLTTLEPTFEQIFRDKGTLRLWFANFILYSSALTVAGCYVPFTDIGSAVMKMLADTRGIRIKEADRKGWIEKFSTMSPLGGTGRTAETPRGRAPVIYLDGRFVGGADASARTCWDCRFLRTSLQRDGVKHHKPSSRQAYAQVERSLAVWPSQLCLIACHTWDTLGVVAAVWMLP